MYCSTTGTFSASALLFTWKYNKIIWAVITLKKINPAAGIKFHTEIQPERNRNMKLMQKKCKNFHIQVNKLWKTERITFVYLWKQLSLSKQMTRIRLRKNLFCFLDTHTYSSFFYTMTIIDTTHTSWPLPSHPDNDSSIIEMVHIGYIWV